MWERLRLRWLETTRVQKYLLVGPQGARRVHLNYSRGSMSKGMKAIHVRIVIGAVILLLAAAAWFYQTTFFSRT